MWQENSLIYISPCVRSVTSLSQTPSKIHEEFNLLVSYLVFPVDIQFYYQVMKYRIFSCAVYI
jgi:hypothetical protein